MRARRVDEMGGSVEQDLRKASHALGETIAAFQTEVKAPREEMPSNPSPDSFRDQEAQPGRNVVEVTRSERVNSTLPPKSVPSYLKL